MYWDTIPYWILLVNYLFLLLTLGGSIFSIKKKGMRILSIVAIVFVITLPINDIINSIGRGKGINELEHLINQLQQGAIWPVYTIVGYIFLIVWWIVFFIKNKDKRR